MLLDISQWGRWLPFLFVFLSMGRWGRRLIIIKVTWLVGIKSSISIYIHKHCIYRCPISMLSSPFSMIEIMNLIPIKISRKQFYYHLLEWLTEHAMRTHTIIWVFVCLFFVPLFAKQNASWGCGKICALRNRQPKKLKFFLRQINYDRPLVQ